MLLLREKVERTSNVKPKETRDLQWHTCKITHLFAPAFRRACEKGEQGARRGPRDRSHGATRAEHVEHEAQLKRVKGARGEDEACIIKPQARAF